MSNVKYGVTFVPWATDPRRRACVDGEKFASSDKSEAYTQAARFPSDCDARIVKITTRPKGWQPTSSPPPVGVPVLTVVNGHDYRIEFYQGGSWQDRLGRCVVPSQYWRHLPKSPKGGQ